MAAETADSRQGGSQRGDRGVALLIVVLLWWVPTQMPSQQQGLLGSFQVALHWFQQWPRSAKGLVSVLSVAVATLVGVLMWQPVKAATSDLTGWPFEQTVSA